MKTIKIISAAVLALLCTTIRAQENSSLLASLKLSPDMNRVETWFYHIHDQNSEELIAEIFIEEEIIETGPYMEDWMSNPFEPESGEEDLSVEAWMTKPFESGEFIPLEEWMTAANWQARQN